MNYELMGGLSATRTAIEYSNGYFEGVWEMIEVKTKQKFVALAAMGTMSAMSMTRPAAAVVLEQKWQAGQTASYAMTLSGTIKVQSSEATPVPWAGMPLEVPVSGNGQLAFDTLNTNNVGGATVRTRVPLLNLSGSAFGMNAVVAAKNGVANFALNGGAPRTFPVPMLVNPAYAVNISRLGRIEGVVAIPGVEAKKASLSSTRLGVQAGVQMVKTGSENGATAMQQTGMQQWLNMMPNFWPGRDIQVGQGWTIEPKIPAANAPGGTLSLGFLNLKLVGQETVGGQTLQHVTLNGTLAIDAAKAAILNGSMNGKANNSKGAVRLVSDSKTLNGDIWFDAAAGRIARASMKVLATNTMAGIGKADAKSASRPWTSTQGFDGTFGMQLNGVAATATSARTQPTKKMAS